MTPDLFTIIPYRDTMRPQLLTIWERSVLATHHFLQQTDFEEIKQMLHKFDFNQLQVYCLLKDESLVGFTGVAHGKIEMLFLDPDYRGQGLGKRLLQFATHTLDAHTLDVNEQNATAIGFYQKAGFQTFERTDTDDQGRPYPLLRMKLKA